MSLNQFLKQRLKTLQLTLKRQQIGVLLVSSPSNLTYLTGIYPFSSTHRDAYLIITPTQAVALVSPLRLQQFSHLKDFQIHSFHQDNTLSALIHRSIGAPASVTIEPNDLTTAEFDSLRKKLRSTNQSRSVKIIKPKQDFIVRQRLIKDDWEIVQIKKACRITAKTWEKIKPQIQPGMTERQISHLIINTLIDLGADGIPQDFDPIVASGPNSAIPHHTTSNRKITKNEVILIDFGCTINGYCSDFTRTISIGKLSNQFIQIETIVKQAHSVALKSLSQISNPAIVDQAARDTVNRAGYGDYFIHTTGHGLGLDIHEPPSLYFKSTSKTKLKPNTTVTIEPGIYLPGKFGYRHENTILITKTGYQTLTLTSTEQPLKVRP